MNKKFIIFLVAISLILSVNCTFAADENATQAISYGDDGKMIGDIAENPEILSDDGNGDIIQVKDNSYGLKDASQTIKMQGVIDRVNGGIWYKASFYNEDGTPLNESRVSFSLDDNNLGWYVNTDSNGVAILKAAIKNGNYKLNAFHPNGDNATVDLKVFSLLSGNKDINMFYDGGNTYTVRAYDVNGNPVKAGEKVTFAIGSKTYVKTTDKNGFAKLKIDSKPGLYQIGARYNNYVVLNDLYVKPVLKPLTSLKNKHLKSTIKFKVKFLGKNKKNKLIKVKFNKKTYKAKTNKKGIAVFKLKTPKKLGKYKTVVSYKKTKLTLTFYKYYI